MSDKLKVSDLVDKTVKEAEAKRVAPTDAEIAAKVAAVKEKADEKAAKTSYNHTPDFDVTGNEENKPVLGANFVTEAKKEVVETVKKEKLSPEVRKVALANLGSFYTQVRGNLDYRRFRFTPEHIKAEAKNYVEFCKLMLEEIGN